MVFHTKSYTVTGYWLAEKIYSFVEEEKDANGILYMVVEEMEGYGNHSTKNKSSKD